MAKRGEKVPEDIREKVRAHYLLNDNLSAAAKEFNLSVSTVHGIVRSGKSPGKTALSSPGNPGAASNTLTLPGTSGADAVTMTELDVRAAVWPRLVGPIVPKIERLYLEMDQEGADQKALTGRLYSLSLAFAILVDKARLLNEKATSIMARAGEITSRMPEGTTKEMLIEFIRMKIGVLEAEHPGLLPAPPDE